MRRREEGYGGRWGKEVDREGDRRKRKYCWMKEREVGRASERVDQLEKNETYMVKRSV